MAKLPKGDPGVTVACAVVGLLIDVARIVVNKKCGEKVPAGKVSKRGRR